MHIDSLHSRKEFIARLLAGSSVLIACVTSCKSADALAHIKGGIVGANSGSGHLLRNPSALPPPVRTETTDILIVGGGISGLAAKRWLYLKGHKDVVMLEMDDQVGGNSRYGRNEVSAYPWGAHYIPVPDLRNTELLDFLRDINVITGYDATGLPVYNAYYMCHEPEERLFINGLWQEGLIPESNVSDNEKKEIKRFLALVEDFKKGIGSDGKDAFAIPVCNSSADPAFRELDKIPFYDYLHTQGYTSKYLYWYLEYCCKDDFGADLQNTSAWAGIHYFASRKGKGANATASTVLTWPQGNGFLMEHLRNQCGQGIVTGHLAYNVQTSGDHAEALVYDSHKKESYRIRANKILMATPQFVNKHILTAPDMERRRKVCDDFQYAPWVIANLTIGSFHNGRGMPLCWDNVIYGKPSVGYVNANHQNLGFSGDHVITFYMPYAKEAPGAARARLQTMNFHQLLRPIVDELEYAHPGITAAIETADIWIWGHGMIAPRPGFIWGESKASAIAPIADRLFFAHTDLSGISIFEEAFYQGIRAANQILAS